MARNPKPTQPLRWDIYRAASKVKWIGSVEAADADAGRGDREAAGLTIGGSRGPPDQQ